MQARQLQISDPDVMSDPEWIALESLDEQTSHFIFDDDMLMILMDRGMAEPIDGRWLVTAYGHQALDTRSH